MSLKSVDKCIITGNTYNNRDAIKKLGGVWDNNRKAWVINISSHPDNTMRNRGGLENEINGLAKLGCRIEYK